MAASMEKQEACLFNENKSQIKIIGHLRSVFLQKTGTPRQGTVCKASRGSLTIKHDVFNNPEHSLDGLQEYSHMWIIFVFHLNNNASTKAKVKVPRLDGAKKGVFSCRTPYRPSPIGLTLAKIESVNGATIHVSGIDIVDGTPVLDIKPYVGSYDMPQQYHVRLWQAPSGTGRHEGEDIYTSPALLEVDRNNSGSDRLSAIDTGASPLKDNNKNTKESTAADDSNDTSAGLSETVFAAEWLKDCSNKQPMTVEYSERALRQLSLFHHTDGGEDSYRLQFLKDFTEARQAITDVLIGDPRSAYRRKSCSDRLYFFVCDSMHITCWFDGDIAEVVKIQPVSRVEKIVTTPTGKQHSQQACLFDYDVIELTSYRNTVSGDSVSSTLKNFMVPDDDPKNMAVHYEVERFRGLYSHAFMSLGVEETAKKVKLYIIHFVPEVEVVLFRLSLAAVKIQTLTVSKKENECGIIEYYLDEKDRHSKEKADIFSALLKGRIVRVKNENFYPQIEEDKQATIDRAKEREGDRHYNITTNNCQHFVTKMLMGYCYSKDVVKLPMAAPLIDLTLEQSLEMTGKRLLSMIPKIPITDFFTEQGWRTTMLGWGKDGWKGFWSKGFSGFAHLQNAFKSVGLPVLVSVAVEALMLACVTLYDYSCFVERVISAVVFAKRLVKNLAASAGSVVGTFIGALIGCCTPLPGAMLGFAMAGGFVGRFISYLVAYHKTKNSNAWLISKIVSLLPADISVAYDGHESVTISGLEYRGPLVAYFKNGLVSLSGLKW